MDQKQFTQQEFVHHGGPTVSRPILQVEISSTLHLSLSPMATKISNQTTGTSRHRLYQPPQGRSGDRATGDLCLHFALDGSFLLCPLSSARGPYGVALDHLTAVPPLGPSRHCCGHLFRLPNRRRTPTCKDEDALFSGTIEHGTSRTMTNDLFTTYRSLPIFSLPNHSS